MPDERRSDEPRRSEEMGRRCDDIHPADCPRASEIAVMQEQLGSLEHAVKGNAQPGLIQNFSEHRSEMKSFIGFFKGSMATIGIVITLALGLLAFILSEIKDLNKALKETGAVSHQQPYVVRDSGKSELSTSDGPVR